MIGADTFVKVSCVKEMDEKINEDNWVTTSMKNNSIKSNYTIDEIHWTLYPKGNIADWDGLTGVFIELVDNDKELLKDSYIKTWYRASKNAFLQHELIK